MNAGVVIAIIIIIIVIVVTVWVWSENEKDFAEIQQNTCDQYHLSEEECQRQLKMLKGSNQMQERKS